MATNLSGAIPSNLTYPELEHGLLDSVLANHGNPAGGGKYGYSYVTGAGMVAGAVNVGYVIQETSIAISQSGICIVCAEEGSMTDIPSVINVSDTCKRSK